MTKAVRKFLIGDLWLIGEHESWFTDMAADGLHLKKMGLLFAHFEKGESENVRYRIDAISNKKFSEEQKNFYLDNGWVYVTKFKEFNIFSSPAELNAPELHTDPAEQAHTLKRFDEKVAKSTLYIIILLSIYGLVMFALLNTTPIFSLLDGSSIQYASAMLLFLGAVFAMIRATFSIRKLRTLLSEGNPINHKAPWKKHRRVNIILSSTMITIAAVGAVLPFVQIALYKTETFPLEHTALPIVRLADIEGNPNLVRNELLTDEGFDIGNQITYNWSPFAPHQYESDEQGIVADQVWEDESGTYSPSIHTQVYKLTFPSMREKVISDLMRRYDFYSSEVTVQVESEVFDTLFIREMDEKKEIFAGKGKGVIYARYYGYSDIDHLLKSVEEKIELIVK